MQPQIIRQFRMKGKGQNIFLPYGNGLSGHLGQHLDSAPPPLDQWCTDENGLQQRSLSRNSGKGIQRQGRDKTVHLPPEGITAYDRVQLSDTGLFRMSQNLRTQ